MSSGVGPRPAPIGPEVGQAFQPDAGLTGPDGVRLESLTSTDGPGRQIGKSFPARSEDFGLTLALVIGTRGCGTRPPFPETHLPLSRTSLDRPDGATVAGGWRDKCRKT